MGKKRQKEETPGPSPSLTKGARRLFDSEEEQERFINSVRAGTSGRSVKVLPSILGKTDSADWIPSFVNSEGSIEERAYKLDLSSVFSASPLEAVTLTSPTVLDMCASPGGKSVLAWNHLAPKLLVSNEVIGKRIPALISNLKRCQIGPVLVTSMDSSLFSDRAENVFDVVLVDAPCSGQSLLARGEESMGAFHPATVNMNSNRQKRILANSSRAVAPGGYLLYMTCTYSREENEGVVEWFNKKFPLFEGREVPKLADFQSPYTPHHCYRLWPYQGFGAGGFTALFQKTTEGEQKELSLDELRIAWRNDRRVEDDS